LYILYSSCLSLPTLAWCLPGACWQVTSFGPNFAWTYAQLRMPVSSRRLACDSIKDIMRIVHCYCICIAFPADMVMLTTVRPRPLSDMSALRAPRSAWAHSRSATCCVYVLYLYTSMELSHQSKMKPIRSPKSEVRGPRSAVRDPPSRHIAQVTPQPMPGRTWHPAVSCPSVTEMLRIEIRCPKSKVRDMGSTQPESCACNANCGRRVGEVGILLGNGDWWMLF
jgi:hypothetical protein